MGDRERNEDERRAIRRITRLLDSRKKGGGERIWKGLDDKTIDLVRLLFAERMSHFNTELDEATPERNREEYDQFQEWKERLMAQCPGIDKDLDGFMDWVVLCGGEETEDAYIFGLMDGIRLMKLIDSI